MKDEISESVFELMLRSKSDNDACCTINISISPHRRSAAGLKFIAYL